MQFREQALNNEYSSVTISEAGLRAYQLEKELTASGVFRKEPPSRKSSRAARALAEVAAEESWEALLQSRVAAVPPSVAAAGGRETERDEALQPAAGSKESTASTCMVRSGDGAVTEAAGAEVKPETGVQAETEGKAETEGTARSAGAVASASVPGAAAAAAAAAAADGDDTAAAGGPAESVAATEISETVASMQGESGKTSTNHAAEAAPRTTTQDGVRIEQPTGGSSRSAATSSTATT